MHDFPTVDYLRALGASPDALRVVWAPVAYMGLAVILACIVYGIVRCTAGILADRAYLRGRALSRSCGVSA